MGETTSNKTPAGVIYEQLVVGYELPHVSYELSAPAISKYLEAVNGESEQWHSTKQGGYKPLSGFVPPMAIAAFSIGALLQSLQMLAGSIHASQELQFLRLVPIGATIECQARVAKKLHRGGLRLLAFELSTLNQEGEQVLSGKATLVLPN